MKPTSNTVEYTLIASPFNWEISAGKTIEAWGFNKQVPGPLLKARKGDTLVVNVINQLLEPTILHWHGIRLQSSMDGSGEVQEPILPGESFTYRFELPDAGTYWYHSHENETVQMEHGLYGGIIVESDEDPVVDHDRIFLIDDMNLDKNNQFREKKFIKKWIERHDGKEGNISLLNGIELPRIEMNAGQVERWRFVNSASARYFKLSLDGKPFRLIATDGNLLEKPFEQNELLITPGERYDILVGPFEKGDTFQIKSLVYNRTTMLKAKKRIYGSVSVGEAKPSRANIPEKLNSIPTIAGKNANINRKIRFSVSPSLKHGIDFTINGKVHLHDKPVPVGELQVWEVSNTSLMDHPFHLHGFFFQVLEENGKPPTYKSWKETYNLKPKSRIKIAWIPDDRPGKWMYHCHILEHHAAGMMAHFEVVPA